MDLSNERESEGKREKKEEEQETQRNEACLVQFSRENITESRDYLPSSDVIVEQEAIEMERIKRIQKAYCIVVIIIIFIVTFSLSFSFSRLG